MTYTQRTLLRRIAVLTLLSLPVALPSVAFSQAKTAEERKAIADQKKAEAEQKRAAATEKRRQQEEERQAKAELQKALLPKEYAFPALGLTFTKPAGWKDTAATPNPNAVAIGVPGGDAPVAPMPADGTLLSLELVSPAPAKPGTTPPAAPKYTVSLSTLPAGTTLEAFVDFTNKSLDTFPEGPLTYQLPTDATLGEMPAKLVIARGKPNAEKQTTVVRRVVAVAGEKGYIFEVVTTSQQFARASASADQLEKSVTFTADATTAPRDASTPKDPNDSTPVGKPLPPEPQPQ